MNPQELSLFHLVRPPTTASVAPPLLLLLHGFGSNEQDLFGLASALDPRFLILSVRGPNVMQANSYAWFQVQFTPDGNNTINSTQAEESRRHLISFIGEAVDAYGANPQQVYLLGFSQGAIMSAAIIMSRPEIVAGAVLMSGRILSEMSSMLAEPARLTGKPVLLLHGLHDKVLPVAHGRASRDVLAALPLDLTYQEYDMGHEISRASLSDTAQWLTARLDAAK